MMLKIDTKSRMKTELINHIGQVTEIFKRDLLILSLSKISDQFL